MERDFVIVTPLRLDLIGRDVRSSSSGHDTNVRSDPRRVMHNFQPYLHQSVNVEPSLIG